MPWLKIPGCKIVPVTPDEEGGAGGATGALTGGIVGTLTVRHNEGPLARDATRSVRVEPGVMACPAFQSG